MKRCLASSQKTALVALLVSAWLVSAGAAAAQGPGQPPMPAGTASTAAMPGWLEPNGLNVVDLVGFVPDEYLKGAIISWAIGIVQYDSGTRSADQVTLHVRIAPRILGDSGSKRTTFECIGQRPYADGWASVAPASKMKLYANGTDITSRLVLTQYVQGGPIQPARNASGDAYSRYPAATGRLTFDGAWAVIPANRGCTLWVPGEFSSLTADFVFQGKPVVRIETLGQEAFQFESYIGPGNVGWFQPVIDQLRAAGWGDRHSKFNLKVPVGADYLLINYPPMPVDAYTGCCTRSAANDQNIARPSGGSYRIGNQNGQLSVDLQSVMGIPIGGQWQDADQSGGAAYLPQFSDGRILAAPEYVVPAGITFQPCLRDGNCPAEHSIIDKIGHTTMPITVTYLSVTRVSPDLQRVPLRQVGATWSPGTALTGASAAIRDLEAAADLKYRVFFAALRGRPLPPDDPTGCPCGWFTADGRMVDYTPGR